MVVCIKIMQSVFIIAKVTNLIPIHGQVYSIQLDVINISLGIFRFPLPIKLTWIISLKYCYFISVLNSTFSLVQTFSAHDGQALSMFQSILLSLGQSINHDNVLYISNYYIVEGGLKHS